MCSVSQPAQKMAMLCSKTKGNEELEKLTINHPYTGFQADINLLPLDICLYLKNFQDLAIWFQCLFKRQATVFSFFIVVTEWRGGENSCECYHHKFWIRWFLLTVLSLLPESNASWTVTGLWLHRFVETASTCCISGFRLINTILSYLKYDLRCEFHFKEAICQ